MGERAIQFSDAEIDGCLAGNVLQLVILPTEACNFRCLYCYETFKSTKMAPSVVGSIARFLSLRAPDLNALTVSWFGGEPLLARDIIEQILLHVNSLVETHPRIRFFSDITTNGYLLSRPVFQRLVELGVVRYQIAFDGPRPWHDKYRRLPNGGGTFDRVWSNLLAMKEVEHHFKVLVRVHINKDNRDSIPEFIDAYHRSFRDDDRFSLFLRPLSRLGGANDAILPVFGEEEGEQVVRSLAKLTKQCGVPRFGAEAPICYAARVNSLVVRADGAINKCTVAFEHASNQVGRLRDDGRLELDSDKLRRWFRGIQSRRPAELKCPLRGIETRVRQPGEKRRVEPRSS
jgi:uncharacterized protein